MTAACQLCLITPTIEDAEAFAPILAGACAGGSVAAVVARLPKTDDRTTINRIKRLAPAAQEHNAAFLVTAPPQVAIRGGADGIHLEGASPPQIEAAIEALKPEWIVGAGGLGSRHDAMVAGEAGVDYVMFGEMDGHLPSLSSLTDMAGWWAEIFSVPCMVHAPTLAALSTLAATGAEFVALSDAVWNAPEGAPKAVEQALAIIAESSVAP